MKIDIAVLSLIGVIFSLLSMIFIFFTKESKLTMNSKGITESNFAGMFALIFFLLGIYHLTLVVNSNGYIEQETTISIQEIQSVSNHTINLKNESLDTRIDVHLFKANNEKYQNSIREVFIYGEKKIKYLGFIDMILCQDSTMKIAYITKEDYDIIKKIELAPEYQAMLDEIREERKTKQS